MCGISIALHIDPTIPDDFLELGPKMAATPSATISHTIYGSR
jgi:hypothetical protein